ncbi:porin family protein [Flavobacterium silvaticum]|uniref:PorT family protein n=1 Tax=Flavobacterium silvaticum TaxID=1852020 RepID=A0A972FLT9_9FLAO|nr:porin family protein [Flavobacterium silvaticum]NMH28098.1 PorT family protein [Flavobacterium silvaticum]
MKKTILSALAFAAFGMANAQSEEIVFGVKAGFSHSTLSGDSYYNNNGVIYNDKYDGRFGGYIGALADIPLSGNFHVQPEVQFSSEGAENAGLVYFRIPVMAKYYLMDNFAVEAGPLLGLRLAGEDDFDERTKAADFGLSGGATYEFPMGVFVEARFNAGIANISDDSGRDLRTASFQVGAGYRF